VRVAMRTTLDTSLRHDDVKLCVNNLARRGFVEEAPVGDNVAYWVSQDGYRPSMMTVLGRWVWSAQDPLQRERRETE